MGKITGALRKARLERERTREPAAPDADEASPPGGSRWDSAEPPREFDETPTAISRRKRARGAVPVRAPRRSSLLFFVGIYIHGVIE